MKNIGYFELKDDIEEFSQSLFVEDKIKSGLKVTGKTLCNVGIYAGKLGVSIVKNLPTILEEEARKIENKKK